MKQKYLANAPLGCNFEVYSDTDNPNLMKVKLKVMHDGENKKTKVTKEALLDAEDSIRNVPILAKVLDDGSDFNEHDSKLEKVNGTWRLKYLEKAIGVVGYDSEVTYTEEDDKTYINATGYIWTRYNQDAVDIINESDQKGVSMEIKIIDGFLDEDEVFNVTKFIFTGITILGDHVESAMYDTYLTQYSMAGSLKEEIKIMCNEIYALNNSDKEVTDLMAKKEDTKKPIEDNKDDETKIVEDVKGNEGEEKPEGIEGTENTEDNEPTEPTEDGKEDDETPDPNEQYSLSVEDMYRLVYKELESEKVEVTDWGDTYLTNKYWVETILPTDKIVVLSESQSWGNYIGVPYEIVGDNMKLDLSMAIAYVREWRAKKEFEEIMTFSVDNPLKVQVNETYSNQKSKIAELTTTVESLEVYKAEKDKEELEEKVEEVTNEFATLTEDEVQEVKDEVLGGNMSLEQYKKELYCMVGMKALNSNEKYSLDNKKPDRVPMLGMEQYSMEDEDDDGYGGLMKKYLKR